MSQDPGPSLDASGPPAQSDERPVWYVGYGSTLSKRRFLQFLYGGPAVSGQSTDPFQDQAEPESDRPFTINGRLYFGGHFRAYGGTAAAFLDVAHSESDGALGRAYKIRWSQFVELWRAENLTAGVDPATLAASTPSYVDAANGSYDTSGLPFGRILRLDSIDAVPVLATTASEQSQPLAAPSDRYLRVIIRGLRETYTEMTESEVLAYVASIPGVAGQISWPRLSSVGRRKSVAIVGGGIAGLYCAHALDRYIGAFDITVLEASPTFGGRIETVDMNGFPAEFGPMRFEIDTQPLLKGLVDELFRDDPQGGFRSFPPMGNDDATTLTAAERYNFRHDESRHTVDIVNGTTSDRSVPDPPNPFDLLRLGVLRMFREPLCKDLGEPKPFEFDLCADTTAPLPGSYRTDGSDKWQVVADVTWIVDPVISGIDAHGRRIRVQKWIDDLKEDQFADLRRGASHRGSFLWQEAFWNAMSMELSAAAIRYIRDEGTFYHLFPDNPSAVEWGIFWLRLFRTGARDLTRIEGGTGELVERLTRLLAAAGHVDLRAGQEVLSVETAADSTAIVLKVRDHRGGRECEIEVDHCVLALPLAPLKALDANFPQQVRADLNNVFGFALLKCFLQVTNPWWRECTPTHSGAMGVPTRELHFQWKKPGTGAARGLVMLYTDHPASEFWKQYVELPVHDRALVGKHEGRLKRALVFHLLIQARRQAHLSVRELLLDAAANAVDPVTPPFDEGAIGEFVRALEELLKPDNEKTNRTDNEKTKEWYRTLIGAPESIMNLGHLERVLDVVRNPSHFQTGDDVNKVREEFLGWINERLPSANKLAKQSSDEVTPGVLKIEDKIKAASGFVELWGIRDWSRWPVGAGCHAWGVGARSWEIMARLEAFGLVGRSADRLLQNVHICGEAISDYQGFIEGALRSASRVVTTLSRIDEEW